jgi:ATP-dependent RNA helicase RhlB
MAWEHMNNPVEIILNPDKLTVAEISQEIYHIERKEKINLLLGILKNRKPGNTLIFTNTKQAAYMVSKRLERNRYHSQYLIGDLPQKKRQKIIETMKSGQLPYLVATDVAARGLHIDNLDLVINYDLPEDPENYVHRIGRTGRTGKSGQAITLACEKYVYGLEAVESFIGMKIPVKWAEESFLVNDESEGIPYRLNFRETHRHSRKRAKKKETAPEPKSRLKSAFNRNTTKDKGKKKRPRIF